MKRPLLTITVFLLLGVVVNVAVAWGCALWVDAECAGRENSASRYTDTERIHISVWRRTGALVIVTDRVRAAYGFSRVDGAPESLLPPWSGLSTARAAYESGTADEEFRVADARGWPMLALWTETEGQPGRSDWRIRGGFTTSLGVPTRFPSFSILPFRPLWPGFAINTVFYAAILWLLICGPSALRRFIRRKRGLCVACGYDLSHADHVACPECGWRGEIDASRALP